MIIRSVIQIVLGWLLWRIVPSYITEGQRKTRARIQLCCNIASIILVVLGIVHLAQALFGALLG